MCQQKLVLMCLLASALVVVSGKLRKNNKGNQQASHVAARGLQCYNCLSYDNPGCWDPEHPDYANVTIPNVDCYIPGTEFSCVVITSESAQLVSNGREIRAVRARTCVPSHEFSDGVVSYHMCNKLSAELAASQVFSRVLVSRPRCALCGQHLCVQHN